MNPIDDWWNNLDESEKMTIFNDNNNIPGMDIRDSNDWWRRLSNNERLDIWQNNNFTRKAKVIPSKEVKMGNKFAEARKLMGETLFKDDSLFYGYQSNIAMLLYDEQARKGKPINYRDHCISDADDEDNEDEEPKEYIEVIDKWFAGLTDAIKIAIYEEFEEGE